MALCNHAQNARLAPPSSSTAVYKEECTQCFDNYDMAAGIDVCLTCFNGACPRTPTNHAHQHAMKSGHQLALNIRRVAKRTEDSNDAESPRPAKLTKLEIKEEVENDSSKYEYQTFVRCWGCSGAVVDVDANANGDGERIRAVTSAIMHAVEATKRSEIKAWTEEVTPCEHFESLTQTPGDGFTLDGLHTCSACEKHENLWLCLSCGHVGCGRRQYDGSGGNNHAISHYDQTGHKVSIKLGTITPEGSADAYCYACDDNKVDPKLAEHLKPFGINVLAQQKTEKSVAELQLEQNLKFDFSMTTADGEQLEPVAGPGLTGLRNLGNSCYMASILQCVFNIDRFRDRYFPTAEDHFATCSKQKPANCVLCQLHKMASGLWSGRYAELQTDHDGKPAHQAGIPPAQFKDAIAQDHYEFSTMRQQDVFEFFRHLNKQIDIAERAVAGGSMAPTTVFDFKTEERFQCLECKKVRYKTQKESSVLIPVIKRPLNGSDSQQTSSDDTGAQKQEYAPIPIAECLDSMVSEELVNGCHCPSCNKLVAMAKSTRFATFPKVLAVQACRFEMVNCVPMKLNVPVRVPLGRIDFSAYRGHGIQPGEEPLPETDDGAKSDDASALQEQPVDEAVVAQLESMGFPRIRCVKAVKATGNNGAEAAMGWVFEHMDDPTIDDPEEPQQQQQQQNALDPEAVEQLMAMGFEKASVEKALGATAGDANRALDFLLNMTDDESAENDASAATGSVDPGSSQADDSSKHSGYELTGLVLHKGTSVHCGHYIANVRHGLTADESRWFMFNDAKVAALKEPQPEQAYVYFFTRTDDDDK
ncbi:ubiquitin C-terminal hydrolase Ubp14 [Coemansia sp. RSA 1200]|nr:ubiquitin C-terminal hydrolase Ubp14 [Coemansia sp. RSA 1200]